MPKKKKDTIGIERQATDAEIRQEIGKKIREMRDKLRHSAAAIAGKIGIGYFQIACRIAVVIPDIHFHIRVRVIFESWIFDVVIFCT